MLCLLNGTCRLGWVFEQVKTDSRTSLLLPNPRLDQLNSDLLALQAQACSWPTSGSTWHSYVLCS